MDHRMLRRTAYGLILAVVIAMAVVVTTVARQDAQEATARAEHAEQQLATTRADLGARRIQLIRVREQLDTTTRSLTRTAQQRAVLVQRTRQCRVLVQVNDRLLHAMTAFNAAATHLEAKRRPAAGRAMARASDHLDVIDTLVRRAGHRDISRLVNSCAPPAS